MSARYHENSGENNFLTAQKITEILAQFHPQQQLLFLLHFVHALTISAYQTYEVGLEEIVGLTILISFNELQYRIITQSLSILFNNQ